MTTRRRLLAVVAVTGALLTGCGEEQGTRETLVENLADPPGGQPGLPLEQAECVADGLYAQFGEEERNAISGADSGAAMSAAARQAVTALIEECGASEGG